MEVIKSRSPDSMRSMPPRCIHSPEACLPLWAGHHEPVHISSSWIGRRTTHRGRRGRGSRSGQLRTDHGDMEVIKSRSPDSRRSIPPRLHPRPRACLPLWAGRHDAGAHLVIVDREANDTQGATPARIAIWATENRPWRRGSPSAVHPRTSQTCVVTAAAREFGWGPEIPGSQPTSMTFTISTVLRKESPDLHDLHGQSEIPR